MESPENQLMVKVNVLIEPGLVNFSVSTKNLLDYHF